MPVHQHLAGHHAHVQRQGRLEQGVRRLRLHRAEHHGGGGPVAQKLAAEEGRALGGIGGVLEPAFLGEDVFGQPVQHLAAIGPHHAGLHIVGVQVDEARRDQPATMIVHVGAGRQGFGDLGIGPDPLDQPAPAQHRPVGDTGQYLQGRGREGVAGQIDQVTADHDRGRPIGTAESGRVRHRVHTVMHHCPSSRAPAPAVDRFFGDAALQGRTGARAGAGVLYQNRHG